MERIVKNILKKIEDNGFETYLVGGYVRDKIIGNKTTDIDICTNALIRDLEKIFPNNEGSNIFGGFKLKYKNYNIDITTFRKEINYKKRFPKVEYINDLKEDLRRRDFTINAICMDSKENIIDIYNGINDINNKIIKIIGDVDKKLTEDPLRMLRCIRFSTILDFDIDKELYNSIKNNYQLIKTLSNKRIKEELDKILISKNFMKGLSLLKELNILDLLDISYDKVYYVNDLSWMWAQLNTHNNNLFTKEELNNIIMIKEIVDSEKFNKNYLKKINRKIRLKKLFRG